MSSLFKRVTVPLLAVAAAAALHAPARAATASYDVIEADPYTTTGIRSRVHLNMTDFSSTWTTATFNTQLLLGNEKYSQGFGINGCQSAGDFYFPSKTAGYYYYIYVNGGGTYNNWCICSVGNSGGAQDVSTGGTNYVSR